MNPFYHLSNRLYRLSIHISILVLVLLKCTHGLKEPANTFVQVIRGSVYAGNYTYYQLNKPGYLTAVLISEAGGDADLYLSSKSTKPTFDFSNHEYESTSCGVDSIHVPRTEPRPLTIGVYGHPSHEETRFELRVFLTKEDELRALNEDLPKEFLPLIYEPKIDMDHIEEEESYTEDSEIHSIGGLLISVLKLILEIALDVLL